MTRDLRHGHGTYDRVERRLRTAFLLTVLILAVEAAGASCGLGRRGGKARVALMIPEQLCEAMRKASLARWARVKAEKNP